MVKKVIPTARSTEPVGRPTQGESVRSHGYITLGNTHNIGSLTENAVFPVILMTFF